MRPTLALGSRIRRLRLTTKQAGKDYYKGTGSGQMGWHTKHGGYIVNNDFVRTYKVPENLKDFKVCRTAGFRAGTLLTQLGSSRHS